MSKRAPKQELLDHLIDWHTPGPFSFSKANLTVMRERHHLLHTKFEMKRRHHDHTPEEFRADHRAVVAEKPRQAPRRVRPSTWQAALRAIRVLDKMPPMTTTTDRDTLLVWNRAMGVMAKGLDFTDAEDRAIFRQRVAYKTTNLRVDTLITLAADWGQEIPKNSSRDTAVKAATGAWMIRRLKQEAHRIRKVHSSGVEMLAGERYRTVAKSTGTMVILVSCPEQGIPVSDGGRWAILCEPHGSLIQDDIQENLRYHMAHPEEWCELCVRKDAPEEVAAS